MADIIEPIREPEYLGDGLYADFDGWQVRLFAHNGIRHTNEVFLEPAVLVAFERYLRKLKEGIRATT